jgi:serine/threonine protein kinase
MSLRGYTKSVDLWSVGCITVVLLTGAPPFQFSASGTPDDGEPGDLNEVFMNIRWDEASTWAQSFVLSLLVLDERERLTVQEALQHSWFTNVQYKSKLKQNYENAVRGWRPREMQSIQKSEKVLKTDARPVDSSNIQSSSKLRLSGNRVLKSTYEEQYNTEEKNNNNKFFHAKSSSHEHAVREDFGISGAPTPHSVRRSFSPRAWSTKLPQRQQMPSSSNLNVDQEPRAQPKETCKQAQIPWFFPSKKNDNSTIPTTIPLLVSIPVAGKKRHLDEDLSQSQEEGEVYEEIENKITGKKQLVPYKER